MKKYQSIEAKRERIAELDELISGTEKGIRALEDYITRCDLAIAEGEKWDTEDTRRILVKTYQAREEYRSERYALIEELHDIATETAEALCTAYEETTNSPADYLAAYRVAREDVRGIRPATAEQHETVSAMIEAIAERTHAVEATEARASWDGAGYYRIAYSDGGQDYTNDGAIWYESAADLVRDLRSAYESATETHLPYAERVGLLEWHITVNIDETAQDFTDTSADGAEDAEEARELLRDAWNRRKPRRLHLAEDTARIIDVYSI